MYPGTVRRGNGVVGQQVEEVLTDLPSTPVIRCTCNQSVQRIAGCLAHPYKFSRLQERGLATRLWQLPKASVLCCEVKLFQLDSLWVLHQPGHIVTYTLCP
jgi:hypothetical protein